MRELDSGWLLRYNHMSGCNVLFVLVYGHMIRGMCYNSMSKTTVCMSKGMCGGWTLYPPLSSRDVDNMSISMDVCIISIHLLGLSSTMGSMNMLSTSRYGRHNGLLIYGVNLYVFSLIITSVLLIGALPLLAMILVISLSTLLIISTPIIIHSSLLPLLLLGLITNHLPISILIILSHISYCSILLTNNLVFYNIIILILVITIITAIYLPSISITSSIKISFDIPMILVLILIPANTNLISTSYNEMSNVLLIIDCIILYSLILVTISILYIVCRLATTNHSHIESSEYTIILLYSLFYIRLFIGYQHILLFLVTIIVIRAGLPRLAYDRLREMCLYEIIVIALVGLDSMDK